MSNPTPPLISFQKLGLEFGPQRVLADINLDITRGTVLSEAAMMELARSVGPPPLSRTSLPPTGCSGAGAGCHQRGGAARAPPPNPDECLRRLTAEGVVVCATFVFGAAQAIIAAKTGAAAVPVMRSRRR